MILVLMGSLMMVLRLLAMVLVVSAGSLVRLVRRLQAKKVISRTVTSVLMVVLKVV